MELNSKGRVIHKGARGGEYVLEKGKKVYKFVKLAPPSSIPKTNVNSKGRVIHKGARGGYYVIEKGRKVYKFTGAKGAPLSKGAPLPKVPSPRAGALNSKGRVIHKGARGGYYVIEKGKKIYKFTRAKGVPLDKGSPLPKLSPIKLKSPVKAKLKKLLEIVRRRRAKPPTQLRLGPTKTLYFSKFDTLRNKVKEKDRPVKVAIPELPSNQVMGVTKDTLPRQSWLDKQSKFIKGLDEYDYMTVMSYTVRSHQWIGPWMRTRNINQVRFTQPYGFMTPLYPQIKSLYQKIPAQNRTSLQNNIINSYMYYTGYINYLPKDDIKKALDMYIEDLQRIIKKAPKLNRTMYVYRGLDRDIFKGKLGTVHTLDYFSSTGYVPQRVYAPQYYMRIKLLKGTRVLLLQGLNNWSYAGEFEVLLNKGSKFVITKRNLKRSVVNNKNSVIPTQKFVTDVTVYN